MSAGLWRYGRLAPLLLLAVTCATPPPTEQRPTIESIKAGAKQERLVSGSFAVDQLDLGMAAEGTNTFRARVTNTTNSPLTLGLDLRATAGMWFKAWQKQFAFDIPPGQTQVIEAVYELLRVTPEATLRLRFGPAVRVSDGPPRLVEVASERVYAVGIGNPAALWLDRAFRQEKTEHLQLFATTGSLADSRLPQIAEQREAVLREITELLAVDPPPGIRLVFYPDEESKRADTGHIGAGLARGNLLVEVYSAETQLDPYHELAHILAHEVGAPPAILNEGLATYLAERFSGSALEQLGHPGRSVDEVVRELAQSGRLVPLERLIQFTEIGSDRSQPAVAYPEAASVVKFLIETHGLQPFLRAFATLTNSDEPEQVRRNGELWLEIFGQSVEQTEVSWRRQIIRGTSS